MHVFVNNGYDMISKDFCISADATFFFFMFSLTNDIDDADTELSREDNPDLSY